MQPWRNREWERVLTVLDLRWRSMPRLSPAAPSRVSRTTAKALSSSSLSRRCGSPMRTVERPMPKRRSLVSRKLGSTRHRFEYSAMICGAVASPLPVTRHQGGTVNLRGRYCKSGGRPVWRQHDIDLLDAQLCRLSVPRGSDQLRG